MSGYTHHSDCTPPADQPAIFTDEARSILLTVWPDGSREVALRDEHRRWLPPVVLVPEPVVDLLAGASADFALLDEMGR